VKFGYEKVKIPKKLKQAKYFILAILKLQYPRKSVYDFMDSGLGLEPDNCHQKIPMNCYISWKTNLLARSHYLDLKDFVSSNEDFNFYFFSDSDQDEWMRVNLEGEEIFEIYNRSIYGASKSDIFRICLLEKLGGAFFSINRVIRLPLKEIIGSGSDFVVSFDSGKYERSGASEKIPAEFRDRAVIQWGMISPPNHMILKIAIANMIKDAPRYSGREFSPPKVAIWNFDGPYMLTRAVDECLDLPGEKSISFAGINYFESMHIPKGSEFRYAVEPSYLGTIKGKILYDLVDSYRK
jgi:mannosyltransferase OCH1-like enzyme